MSGRLHLLGGEAALEVALEELLRARAGGSVAVELGQGLTTAAGLLREASAHGGGASIGELGVRLIAHTLCLEARAATREPGVRALPVSLAPALARTIAALRRVRVTPAQLRGVAPRLPEHARADAQWLAGVLARYEQLLGERADPAALERAGLADLRARALPALREIAAIELHEAVPLDPRTRLVAEALAARGLQVRCQVPELVERPGVAPSQHELALSEAVQSGLDAIEALEPSAIERVLVPLGPGPLPSLLVAPTEDQEASSIARRVRDHVAAGAACDAVVVVAPTAAQRSRLARALRRYGLPVEQLGDERAAEAGLARVLMQVLRLAEEAAPRDGLAALLASPYVVEARDPSGLPIAGARVARALREALPESVPVEAWRGALAGWVSAQPPRARDEAASIVAHVLALREQVLGLPARASLAEHARAIRALIDALEMPTRARAFTRSGPPAAEDEVGLALARDQAALRVIVELLDDLPRAATRCGLDAREYARAEVAALFQAELAARSLRAGGGRGAAVSVCAPAQLVEREASLLVLACMDEAAFEQGGEDVLLHEETLRTLGRALDRALFDAPGDAARRARLRVARARTRAAAVIVSCARGAAGGALLLPGELVLHARACGAIEEREPLAIVHAARDARTPEELMQRLLLEEDGDAVGSEALSGSAREVLRRGLAPILGERLARAEALVRVERDRASYFASEREPGRHDGRLSRMPPALVPGAEGTPLSASAIERYVSCPQRFFLESVLRLRPPEETSDELDERAGGGLAHLALERLFSAWREAGLLPLRGRAEEEAAIGPALDEAVARWRAENPTGNPVLFALRRRALERLLEAVWRRERERPAAPGLIPSLFEHRFDRLPIPGGPVDAPPAYLRGAIDRVDLGVGRATVFDYKSARVSTLRPGLAEEVLADTSWQLPLYAAILRAERDLSEVEMAYYSLRELEVVSAPAPAWVVLDGPSAEPTLAARLWDRISAMRAGRFEVAPRPAACETCRLQAACRVGERRGDDEEGEA